MSEVPAGTGASRRPLTRAGTLAARFSTILLPLLMVTLPLEFTKMYFPSRFLQVGRFVMVAVVATLLVAAYGGQRVQLPARRLWLPPAAFIALAGISAVFTVSTAGVKAAGAPLAYALVALAIFNWTRSVAAQDRVWLWFAISCIGLSVIAMFQRVTGGYLFNAPTSGLERANATFADPNVLARVLTCMIVAGIALAPSVLGRRTRALMIVGVVLSAAALPLTYSRQAWVFGALTLVLAVVTSRQRRQALVLAGVAVALFVVVTFAVPGVQVRFQQLQSNLVGPPTHLFPGFAFLNYLPLDSERHYLVAAGLQMFLDHPFLGLGFGGFPKAMLGPYHGFILPGYTTIDSHTSFVTIAAELGLAGVVLLAWWIYEYLRASTAGIRRDPVRRAYILAPLLAVIVIVLESQLNGRLLDEPYLWVFFGLLWAALAFEGGSRVPRVPAHGDEQDRSDEAELDGKVVLPVRDVDHPMHEVHD